MLQLSKADGADRTRAEDAGTDQLRNGEPNGELGMVIQKDFAWQEQTFDRGFGIKTRGNGFFKSRVILGIFQRLNDGLGGQAVANCIA